MPDPLTIVWALAQTLPVALLGCALAALLRRARLPIGWRAAGLAGGVLAGLLLGATGFARLAPAAHERLFIGGQQQHVELAELQVQQEAERAALARTGVSSVAIEELERRHADRRATVRSKREREMRRRVEGRAGAIALALATLLLVNSRRARHPLNISAPSMSALAAGVGFALFPAVVFGAVLWRGFGVAPALAFALGACIGAGWPAAARSGDGQAAAQAERVSVAGLTAFAIALIAVAALAPAAGAFFAGLACLGVWLASPRLLHAPRWLGPAIVCVAGAVIGGLAVVGLDLAALAGQGRFWIVLLVALLLAADGRGAGAWVGWRLAGDAAARSAAWRHAAAMLGSGVGAAQLSLAALAGASAPAGAPSFALAAVALSALWVEASAPIARRFAPALDEGGLP